MSDVIETEIRFVRFGNRVIGLPPRLDTDETQVLIEAVNESLERGVKVDPETATKIVALFYQPDLINLF